MNNIATSFKFELNVDEQILSENFKMFCFCSQFITRNFDPNCNGFLLFDYEIIKTSYQLLIYNLIKTATDKKNIILDNYNIIIRPVVQEEDAFYDIYIDYGEYHDIKNSEGNIIEDCCDFKLDIFLKKTDNIINIGTDLTKQNTENEPIINNIYLFRPQIFSAFLSCHSGNYFFKHEDNNKDINCCCSSLSIEFIHKNNGSVNYPKFSDVFQNEQIIHNYCCNFFKNNNLDIDNILHTKFDNIQVISNIINENNDVSSNTFILKILEKYNYTFEKLYRSLFPGVYNEPNNEIKHYDIYENTDTSIDDINMVFNHKCIGMQTITINTRNIISEITEYMKINDIYYIIIS